MIVPDELYARFNIVMELRECVRPVLLDDRFSEMMAIEK